jgi:hypothetical protein
MRREDLGDHRPRDWQRRQARGRAAPQLAESRRATFQAGMHRVQALTAEAVDTLAALMRPKMPPAVRLGAARTVAELGTHQHDAETILEKLEQIEAFQREQDNRLTLGTASVIPFDVLMVSVTFYWHV